MSETKTLKLSRWLCLIAFLASTDVCAQTFTETGDAGQTLGSATLVPGQINQLNGNLSDITSDVDLYRIILPAVSTFTLEVSSFVVDYKAYPAFLYEPDSILYLFDATGAPIALNDDRSIPPGDIDLLSTVTTGPLAAGTYYVAIGSYDARAIDSENDQWWLQDQPIPADFDTLNGFVFELAEAPFLDYFDDPEPYPSSDYSIEMSATTVPEPNAAFLLVGLSCLLWRRRR
ncbi:MAG: DVUA0089 family protein [Verrucomicrobiota bacterium]